MYECRCATLPSVLLTTYNNNLHYTRLTRQTVNHVPNQQQKSFRLKVYVKFDVRCQERQYTRLRLEVILNIKGTVQQINASSDPPMFKCMLISQLFLLYIKYTSSLERELCAKNDEGGCLKAPTATYYYDIRYWYTKHTTLGRGGRWGVTLQRAR